MKYAPYKLSNYGKHFKKDETSENYLAFAAWIVTGKMPNLTYLMDEKESNKRMKELDEIYARGERPELSNLGINKAKPRPGNQRKRAVKVTNIETQEEKNFSSIKDASRYLSSIWNMKSSSIEAMLRKKSEYKGYKIEVSGYTQKRKKGSKPIIAINIKTGERIKFHCLNECAEYIGNLYKVNVGGGFIRRKEKLDEAYRDTWKFESIEVG